MAAPCIAVRAETAAFYARACALAEETALPYAENAESKFDFFLHLTSRRLELRENGQAGSVYAEFVRGAAGYRRRHGGGRNQALARAAGLKGAPPTVLDATAGLGQDAFVLACLGCTVTMLERSPVAAALLADGLHRAQKDPETAAIVRERMNLVRGDACVWMRQMDERPDVVYLDPMYPPDKKAAPAKKEMRMFRAIMGMDADAPALLEAALGCARKRVAVKRPKGAQPLAQKKPSMAIHAKSTRFDVYVI